MTYIVEPDKIDEFWDKLTNERKNELLQPIIELEDNDPRKELLHNSIRFLEVNFSKKINNNIPIKEKIIHDALYKFSSYEYCRIMQGVPQILDWFAKEGIFFISLEETKEKFVRKGKGSDKNGNIGNPELSSGNETTKQNTD